MYVESYDDVILKTLGEKTYCGLPDREIVCANGLEKIRKQPKLSDVYIKAVRSFADNNCFASEDLVQMDKKLGLNYDFNFGEVITVDFARSFLRDIIRSIASVVDNADSQFLVELEEPTNSLDVTCAAMSCYMERSRKTGQSYTSLACPEFYNNTRDDKSQLSLEQDMLLRAFNIWETLDLFGHPKIDICRTSNCPSHGKSKSFKNRTVVGGCGFCIECHKILQKDKSPEKIYQTHIENETSLRQRQKKVGRSFLGLFAA
jgi:hypothetical protein